MGGEPQRCTEMQRTCFVPYECLSRTEIAWASVDEVVAEALSCFHAGVKEIHTRQIVFGFPSMRHSPIVVIHT